MENKRIRPIVYISKLDLLKDLTAIEDVSRHYEQIGYNFAMSLDQLLPHLRGKVTVFMGQTGVGKSTLLNKISPELGLETAAISDSLGRGRHTTRAVSFYNVNGGKIADTPGFSNLDYAIDNGEDLSEAFPEIRHFSHNCKFRSCSHRHEPQCAVIAAVEAGRIWQRRYDNYLQFLSEIENRRETFKKVIKRK